MSKLEKQAWGYEYTSDNGITYEIGEVTSEFNVVIDNFMDICEMFDTIVLIQTRLIDYVYGNLMWGDEDDIADIKDWLDDRIARYENHERTVRFYRDTMGAEDTLYECYLGLDEEKYEESTRISTGALIKMAREDSNNNTK